MKYLFQKKRNIFLVSLLDAAGAWLIRIRRPKKTDIPKDAPRFLVIRLDHLGDVFLSTAIAKALKENFPKAHVTYLVGSWSKPMLEANPFIDEILVYDAPWFARGQRSSNLRSFFTLAKKLRSLHFDAALGLRGDLRENFLMARARIPRRIGFGVTGGGFWLTDEVAYRPGIHEEEHLRDLLKPLGIKAEILKPHLYFSEAERSVAEELARKWGLEAGIRWVGFQVGSGSPSKNWPRENTNQFLGLFARHFPNCGLVFVGNDKAKMSELRLPSNIKYVDLVSKTSLRELALLTTRLTAFVGPDSGPSHIASGMGVPTLFIYSGTNDLKRWKPLSEDAIVLRQEVPCSPCELEICNVKGHPCMALISPQKAIDVLKFKIGTV